MGRISKPVSDDLCISGPRELVESKSPPELIEAFKAACLKAAEGIAKQNKEIGHIEPTDVLFNALKEREKQIADLQRQLAEARKDAERLDHIQSRAEHCGWTHQSWITRYYMPELVNEPVGSRWNPSRVTRATVREALDDGIKEMAEAIAAKQKKGK